LPGAIHRDFRYGDAEFCLDRHDFAGGDEPLGHMNVDCVDASRSTAKPWAKRETRLGKFCRADDFDLVNGAKN
jgi:hypothetical protein